MFYYYTLSSLLNPITEEVIIPAGTQVHVRGNANCLGKVTITSFGAFGEQPINALAPVEHILCFDSRIEMAGI